MLASILKMTLTHSGYGQLNDLKYPVRSKIKFRLFAQTLSTRLVKEKDFLSCTVIKSRLGDKLVHFGRGFHGIKDKMQGIYGYRFHLCMENCCTINYCTEKLIDSYLGWSFPLYYGCTNVDDIYPANSLIKIDINNADESARKMVEVLDSNVSLVEKHALIEARRIALEEKKPICIYGWSCIKILSFKYFQRDDYHSITQSI